MSKRVSNSGGATSTSNGSNSSNSSNSTVSERKPRPPVGTDPHDHQMDHSSTAAPAAEGGADAESTSIEDVADALGFTKSHLHPTTAPTQPPPPPDQAAEPEGELLDAGTIDTAAVLGGRPAGVESCKVRSPRPPGPARPRATDARSPPSSLRLSTPRSSGRAGGVGPARSSPNHHQHPLTNAPFAQPPPTLAPTPPRARLSIQTKPPTGAPPRPSRHPKV